MMQGGIAMTTSQSKIIQL